jgi:hypothetical protein
MSHTKLKKSLQQLQTEIDNLNSLPAAEKRELEAIVHEIRRMLENDSLAADDTEDMQGTLGASITRFEASHPRLTGVLNDIMVSLSNMGI